MSGALEAEAATPAPAAAQVALHNNLWRKHRWRSCALGLLLLQVCLSTVGVLGDLCRNVETDLLPYCDEIMQLLIHNLSSNEVHRTIKPQVCCMLPAHAWSWRQETCVWQSNCCAAATHSLSTACCAATRLAGKQSTATCTTCQQDLSGHLPLCCVQHARQHTAIVKACTIPLPVLPSLPDPDLGNVW